MCSLLLAEGLKAQATVNADVEITNERGMYSKVFLKPNGDHQAVISASPIHYKENAEWKEINTNIIPDGGNYKNETNVIRFYFPANNDAAKKIRLQVNFPDDVFIHSQKQFAILDDQNVLTLVSPSSVIASANLVDNTITYPGIYETISDEFKILNGELKNNVLLSALPTVLQTMNSGYFGFRETIELPSGWTISSLDTKSLTTSALLISDALNKPVFYIPEPVFFDNDGLRSDGSRMVQGKYLVDHTGNSWTLTTLVPVPWLKDGNTKYPVSLDPSLSIVGTTGGWQSPNNFVDNPSFVFIGVCCSNLTHRAWIKFNISSVPSTSCVSSVEIQPNVTSVANTVAEGVLINDVTGTFGPYGAINAAAYTDFGNGNYTSFTITSTGLYGFYNLGASACSLLQSQIPGGWFQVAFQFVNEPSTNYKIITATSSSLRVTYTAPPCPVLPIELLSFDAKCSEGKINLDWKTASQRNNKSFAIKRSKDGINYERIATVAGAGNSSQVLSYFFTDENPFSGTSYYSLEQTDYNGETVQLKTIAVNCQDNNVFGIYPNPGAGLFVIDGMHPEEEAIITDVFGQIIFQGKIVGKTEIDLTAQPNGVYFFKTFSETGFTSKKIVISK